MKTYQQFLEDQGEKKWSTFAKATVGKDKLSRETRDDIVFFDRLHTEIAVMI